MRSVPNISLKLVLKLGYGLHQRFVFELVNFGDLNLFPNWVGVSNRKRNLKIFIATSGLLGWGAPRRPWGVAPSTFCIL